MKYPIIINDEQQYNRHNQAIIKDTVIETLLQIGQIKPYENQAKTMRLTGLSRKQIENARKELKAVKHGKYWMYDVSKALEYAKNDILLTKSITVS